MPKIHRSHHTLTVSTQCTHYMIFPTPSKLRGEYIVCMCWFFLSHSNKKIKMKYHRKPARDRHILIHTSCTLSLPLRSGKSKSKPNWVWVKLIHSGFFYLQFFALNFIYTKTVTVFLYFRCKGAVRVWFFFWIFEEKEAIIENLRKFSTILLLWVWWMIKN